LIYYNLRYCESYRGELRLFEEALKKEMKIPLLLIETEYSPSDVGTITTKVEAFLEMIRGV
jgi:benzoyl-CoA reductase/2-hydroxyglutaryl-CoA dehydratase subunit BcrC/BadD/HgdB